MKKPISKLPPTYYSTVFHSMVTFLGQSTMQVVDLLFCRKLGAEASATIGTSTAFFAWFLIVGIGLVSSLEFFIPKSLGEKNELHAQRYFVSGLLLCFITAIVSSLALVTLGSSGEIFGITQNLQTPVRQYCTITAWGYLPVFLTPLLRIELQARGYPHESTYAFLIGNLLNLFLNWIFVLGNLGLPALGTEGSAWASLISRWGIVVYLSYRTFKIHSQQNVSIHKLLSSAPLAISIAEIKATSLEVLKKGIPISLHMFFEMGAFILVSVFSSQMNAIQSAAHTIVISIASFTFMIPLGVGSAAALTISHALGEKNILQAQKIAKTSIRYGIIFAVISCAAYLAAPYFWMELYTSDPIVIHEGAKIMLIAGMFQLGDALQVILSGILRGWGETRIQALFNGAGHWVVGLPIGYYLGFHQQLHTFGLWIGLSIGLFTVAAALFIKSKHLWATRSGNSLN